MTQDTSVPRETLPSFRALADEAMRTNGAAFDQWSAYADAVALAYGSRLRDMSAEERVAAANAWDDAILAERDYLNSQVDPGSPAADRLYFATVTPSQLAPFAAPLFTYDEDGHPCVSVTTPDGNGAFCATCGKVTA